MGSIIGYAWYELLTYHPVTIILEIGRKLCRVLHQSSVIGFPVGFV
jgi:hypothetical protein